MVNIDEYQAQAKSTNHVKSSFANLIYVAFGLPGEAGEFTDEVKKWLFQGHDFDKEALVLELGDLLWYVAIACDALGVSMSEVLQANIKKRAIRYPNGFTIADSKNRIDLLAELTQYRPGSEVSLTELIGGGHE